jgi:hypothetical protein
LFILSFLYLLPYFFLHVIPSSFLPKFRTLLIHSLLIPFIYLSFIFVFFLLYLYFFVITTFLPHKKMYPTIVFHEYP